jgi:hypothetical protein
VIVSISIAYTHLYLHPSLTWLFDHWINIDENNLRSICYVAYSRSAKVRDAIRGAALQGKKEIVRRLEEGIQKYRSSVEFSRQSVEEIGIYIYICRKTLLVGWCER